MNLDPANEHTSYTAAVDVRELVTLESIMAGDDTRLGPNGAVLYALEELENNLDWLENSLKNLGDDYLLFDCPGQVELFTHHDSLRRVVLALVKMGYRVSFSFSLSLSLSCSFFLCRVRGCVSLFKFLPNS